MISDSKTDLKTVVKPVLHSNQVTTRTQSKNNDPIAPLCNKVLNLDVSEEEFSTLQKSDPSLQKYTHDFSDTKNITIPFSKIAIDIVGELPMTTNKNRYILTVIDYATRSVETIPLKI